MTDDSQKCVAVIGQGYVGLPLAQACVAAGSSVVGFDVDECKVEALQAGRSPIDDVSDADVQAMMRTGRYAAAWDPEWLAGCDVYLVAVPTPLRDGHPDLSAVVAAAAMIGPFLADGDLVVLESTVAPGTTRGIFAHTLEMHNPAGAAYVLGYSPERIDPGSPDWRFENTPKLVAGVSDRARQVVASFYSRICREVVPCPSVEVAESAKLLENTYRYVNIALVNELGRHLRAMGVDIWQVVAAAATKPYGFQAFWPGPGVGGHCLPVDSIYLSDGVERELGVGFDLIEAARRINASQPDYVVERAVRLLNTQRKPVNGSVIIVLGISYKRGTADTRETPALRIVDQLRDLGATVIVSDPHLRGDLPGFPDVKVVDHHDVPRFAATSADLIILVTDHDEVDYHGVALTGCPVLDTRARFGQQPNVHAL